METSRTKICPFCGKAVPAIANSCRLCGGEFVRPASVASTHVVTAAGMDKKTARRLFWLGFVLTFIGCLHSASRDPELAGDVFHTVSYALATAALNYLAGIFPAVANSFSPPFLGESGGLVSKVLVFAGAATLVWACRYFVRGKGYRQAWGYLGILGIPGILVLIVLGDKYRPRAALRHRGSY